MPRFSIFVSFLFLLLSVPNVGLAASLSVSPATGTYSVGDQVRLKVLVSSRDAPLNAISGTLSFPSSLFAVQSISKADSILNFWVAEPVFSASSGAVHFEGVSLSGFQGNDGTVVTVVLRALKVGSGMVSFQSGQVLANDGQGTDITANISGGSFQIRAVKAPPPILLAKPSEEKVIQEVPSVQVLVAPIISLGERGGLPSILGSSVYKNADILLTFVPIAGSKIFITGNTDGDGSFGFPVPKAFRSGPYAVSAVVALPGAAQSTPSNMLTIEIKDDFAQGISSENAAFASLFLTIILLTFVGYLMSRRHFTSKKGLSTAVKKEVKQAEDVLHKSFTLLEQDIVDHLKSRGASGKVDSKEREDIASLKKDLKEAESYISREIRDISSVQFDEKE